MAKKYTKQEELETEERFNKLLMLLDRSDVDYGNYGTYAKPKTYNGYTFSHFEIDPQYKKPRNIRTFIKLLTMGSTCIDKFKKGITNVVPKGYTVKLPINSIFKNDNGEIITKPQSGNRARSYNEIYVLTKYFYPSLTLEKFFNYVFKTVYVNPASGHIWTTSFYSCGTIGRSVFSYGNLNDYHFVMRKVNGVDKNVFANLNPRKIKVLNGNIVSSDTPNSVKLNTSDFIKNTKNNVLKSASLMMNRPEDECLELIKEFIKTRNQKYATYNGGYEGLKYSDYAKFITDDDVVYLDSYIFCDLM